MFTPVHQAWLESSLDVPDAPLQPPSQQQFSVSPIPFPQLEDDDVHGIAINYVQDRTALEKAFGSSLDVPLYDAIDALADLVFDAEEAQVIQAAFAIIHERIHMISSERRRLKVFSALHQFRASFDHFNEWYHTLNVTEQAVIHHYYYGDE